MSEADNIDLLEATLDQTSRGNQMFSGGRAVEGYFLRTMVLCIVGKGLLMTLDPRR